MISKLRVSSVLFVAALTLLACKEDSPAPEKTEPSIETESSTEELEGTRAFPADLACTEESVHEVNEWLAKWNGWHKNGMQLRFPETGYVSRDGARIALGSAAVHISNSGIRGSELTSWDDPELHDRLTEYVEASAKESSRPVVVAIEADVAAEKFVEPLMKLAANEEHSFVFAFAAPMVDELQLSETVKQKYPRLFSTRPVAIEPAAIQNCKSAINYTRAFTRTPEAARWSFALQNLGNAWLECECELNLERRLAEMTSSFHREPLATQAAFRLSATGEPLAIAPDAKWGEVYREIISAESVALKLVD